MIYDYIEVLKANGMDLSKFFVLIIIIINNLYSKHMEDSNFI